MDDDAAASASHPVSTPDHTGFVDAYRALGGLSPTGVSVLSCRRGGRPQAITVASYLDVSYDPPTMAVSVYSGSRMMEALEVADTCVLSVLAQSQKGIAQWLGTPGQPSYGILDGVATHPSPAGDPVIAGCVAYFELAITQRIEIATHVLVAGPVTACAAGAADDAPLVRVDGDYRTVSARGV